MHNLIYCLFFFTSFVLAQQEIYYKFGNKTDYLNFKKSENNNNTIFFNDAFNSVVLKNRTNLRQKKSPLLEKAILKKQLPQTFLATDTNFNDPKFNSQWELDAVNVKYAWNKLEKDDTNFLVAIVDGGMRFDCIDLQNYSINTKDSILNNVDDDNNGFIDDIYGWDFGDYDNNPELEKSEHGFEMNSILASIPNNSVGMVSPGLHMKYMHLKIVDDNNYVTNPYEAVKYAIDNGAQVVNCSWYQNEESDIAKEIVDYAESKDVLLVAAAGNNGNSKKVYPAGYSSVLSVGALEPDLSILSSSNYGNAVDIYAPGYNLSAVYDTNKFASYSSGTSSATAFVSSSAVLLRKLFPKETAAQIKNRIVKSARKINSSKDNSALFLNLKNAVDYQTNLEKGSVLFINAIDNQYFDLSVEFYDELNTITIYNSQGNFITEDTFTKTDKYTLLTLLSKGFYIAKIESKNYSKTIKFVIIN